MSSLLYAPRYIKNVILVSIFAFLSFLFMSANNAVYSHTPEHDDWTNILECRQSYKQT